MLRQFLRDGVDVFGGCAAATAREIEQTVLGKVFKGCGGVFGFFVITCWSERVGETSIGIAVDPAACYAGELLQVGSHSIGPEGAVKSNAKRLGVGDGVPTGLGRLPREGAAGGVGNGDRHDNGESPTQS